MSRARSEKRRYTSAREQAQKQSLGFVAAYLKVPEKTKLFKPKTGVMLLDILPYEAGQGNPNADEGMLHWERTFNAHRGIGANSDSYLCPRLFDKSRCPVCEHRLTLLKTGDEDDEDLVKELSPKQRQLFNVINLKDPDKGVQLWDISYHLFGKLLYARLRDADEEDEWEKFFFLEGGLTLKVGFAERSFGGVSFHEAETIDFKPRKQDYDDDILEQVHNLDDILVLPDYKNLKKTFLETRDDDNDDDDEPKSRKSSRDDDDDNDDDEPKAKRRDRDGDDDDDKSKSKKKVPSDDDDDWDDFDEDDDKPKSKSSKNEVDDDDDDDDDDRPRKKKNQFAEQKGDKGWDKDDDDDDDDDKPKKKKVGTPADDDDDEE